MNIGKAAIILAVGVCLACVVHGAHAKDPPKKRIIVVSSYHREYLWSQETNKGFCDAMLKQGYFDTRDQAEEYTRRDYVETSKVVIKKLWMDAKRRKRREAKIQSASEITRTIREFDPTLIFLGDDDAHQRDRRTAGDQE